MSKFRLETKSHLVTFNETITGDKIIVMHYLDKANNQPRPYVMYLLPYSAATLQKLQAYKSLSALVKYAKANQIQPQAETSCPVPAKLQGKPSPRLATDLSDAERGIFSFTDILHITQHELESTPDTTALLAIKQQNETIYQHCSDTDNIKSGDQDFMQVVAKQIDDALTANTARAPHACLYCPDWFDEPIRKNGGVFASCCGSFLAYEELSA